MAQLTSDIVWLVEQSITLPDGSVQRVLVPQVARDNIEVIGGRVEAGDRLTAKAGGNLNVQSTTRSASNSATGVDLKSTYVDRVAGLYVTHPGGELKLTADKNITLKGAEVKSAGSATMDAGVDLNLETLTTGNAQESHWSAKNSRQDLRVQEVGSTVQGAGDVTVGAGRDFNARAATLSAGEDATLHLQAGRHLTLEAGVNQVSSETHHKNKSGINYFTQDASSTQTSLDRTALKAGRIELQSTTGDTTLSAIEANAKSLDIQAGGQLLLQTASTVEQRAEHITHGSAATVGAQGKGSTDETLHYNQLNVGQVSIDAKGGIQAQAGQHVRLDELAQQPGMAWVDQIRNDPKLANSAEWQRVEEAHEKWQYRQSGMGPVSTALVAVMVGVVAAPAAAAAGAAAGGAAGGAAGSTLVGTVVGGAVQSGVLALSNQVAISFFNNHGDLGAVFDDLGSKESVRNLATAIVTGGVLAGMNFNPAGAPTPGSGDLKFFTQLADNLKIQTTSALIRTAINGGSLEDSLKDALKTALINSFAATAADTIGDLSTGKDAILNGFTNKLAHMLAGCALGAAKADSGAGCTPGAIGAAVGELAAEGLGRTDSTVYMAGLFGGLAATLTGGNAEQINVANWAGSNAAANNYLSHLRPSMLALSEQERFDVAKAACNGGAGVASACVTMQELAQTSASRDAVLRLACAQGPATPSCNAEMALAQSMGNKVFVDSGGGMLVNGVAFPTAGPVVSPFTTSNAGQMAQSTAEGLILETGNQAIGALGTFVRWQTGIAPAQRLTPGQVFGGSIISGVVSDGVYLLSNGNDATPAGVATAFAAGYVGGGVTRRVLNYGARLPHTIIPVSVDTAATQFVGGITGYGTFNWMNQTGVTATGNTWWTSPVRQTDQRDDTNGK